MLKVKNIVFTAGFGFVLSFLISICCAHNFGRSLLRGLFFAVVFAILAAIIDFVYGKFLDDGNSVDFSPEGSHDKVHAGSKVDITIDDADLTEDGQDLFFAVSNNRQSFSEKVPRNVSAVRPSVNPAAVQSPAPARPQAAPVPQSAPAAPQAPAHAAAPAVGLNPVGFQPVTLGKPLVQEEGTSDMHSGDAPAGAPAGEAPAVSAKKAERNAEKKEINELPDLDIFDNDEKDSSYQQEIIEDSDFAEKGNAPVVNHDPIVDGRNNAPEHDTATLAKAIQTVLKRED